MNIGELRELITSHARSTQVLSALGLALEARVNGALADGEAAARTEAVVDAALRAMARLIRWKLPLHGEPTAGTARVFTTSRRLVRLDRIAGHRDVNATSCPGDALYAQLPDLRQRVGAQPPAPAGPPPELILKRRRRR